MSFLRGLRALRGNTKLYEFNHEEPEEHEVDVKKENRMSQPKKIETPSHLEAFRQNILSNRDPGRQAVKVCCTTGCRAGGALKIIDTFKKELAANGLEDKVEVKSPRLNFHPSQICYPLFNWRMSHE